MRNYFPLFFGKSFISCNVFTFGADYRKYKPYAVCEGSGLIEYGKEYLSLCAKDKSINDVIEFFLSYDKLGTNQKKNVLSVTGKEMVVNKTKMSREVVDELNENENAGLLSNELK